MARLLLLRHGQSTWNAERRWQGIADPPLSAAGEEQARAASVWLGGIDPGFAGVITSDLQRSRRTGEIIAGILGLGEVEPDPAFRERDVGEWSGCTTEEIATRWPGTLQDWRDGRLASPPGGEADEAFLARLLPAVERLCDRPAAALLVVTHGGAIRALERYLGASAASTGVRAPANLCGRWLRRSEGGDPLRPEEAFTLPDLSDPDPDDALTSRL